jgi:hypothetical protein
MSYSQLLDNFELEHRVGGCYVTEYVYGKNKLYYTNVEQITVYEYRALTNITQECRLNDEVFNHVPKKVREHMGDEPRDISFKGSLYELQKHLMLLYPHKGRNQKIDDIIDYGKER